MQYRQVHSSKPLLVCEAHLRLIIDLSERIQQLQDFVLVALNDSLEKSLIRGRLFLPKFRPRFGASLRGNHLEPFVRVKVLIDVRELISLPDVALHVVD